MLFDRMKPSLVRKVLSLATRTLLAACILSAASVWSARAEAPPTETLEAGRVILQLAETLAAGRRDTAAHLKRLGFQAEVERITTIDGNALHTFSSRSMIESLYRRVELKTKGEGERFLAVLYNDARTQSLGIDQDPAFAHLRRFSADDLKRPFEFADPAAALRNAAARPALPAALESAIAKLAEFYSGRHLSQARGILRRVLRKDGFGSRNIDAAIAEEKTARDVLRRLFTEGTPPPRIDTALREVMRATMSQSAAFGYDPATLKIMEDLSTALPPELERYVKAEDSFESRKRQTAEAARAGLPGKDASIPSAKDVFARIGATISQAEGAPRQANTSAHDQPPPPPAVAARDLDNPKGGDGGGGAGGGGGGSPSAERAKGSSSAYETYNRSTFAPRNSSSSPQSPTGGPAPTPRSYRVAIRSPHAARGIAIGGNVHSEITSTVVRATWIANLKDDRFGRIFVEFAGGDGKPQTIAASRVLFADSFYAAMDVLSGTRSEEAKFQDGEILVLISMDPSAQVTKDSAAEVGAKIEELEKRHEDALEARTRDFDKKAEALQKRITNAKNPAERTKLTAAIEALEKKLEAQEQKLDAQSDAMSRELDRNRQMGIVVHPGIFGRELAWSCARVDFWFNQMPGLAREAAIMNGGKAMPDGMKNISFAGLSTWQFFERDAMIRLGDGNEVTRPLVVASKREVGESTRGHFGISMFGGTFPTITNLDGLRRLPGLETEVEALLDWLAVNHHDFVRLNDFSEAFSLLRWLGSAKALLTVIDMDGQGRALATPDRVRLGVGPGVGR